MSYKQVVKHLTKVLMIVFLLCFFRNVNAECADVFLFLRSNIKNMSFKIEKIEVFNKKRKFILSGGSRFFNFKRNFGQIFLGEAYLPENTLLTIKLKLNSIYLNNQKIELRKEITGRVYFPKLKKDKVVLILILQFLKKKNLWYGNLTGNVAKGVNTIRLILGIDKKNQGLWVIDALSNKVEWFKNINGDPVYLSKGKNGVYVVCKEERSLRVFDPRSLELQQKFFLGDFEAPEFLLINEDKGLILSPPDKQIGIIDLDTGQVIKRIYINYTPNYAALVPNLQEYVVSTEEGKVLIFDEDLNLIKEIAVSFTPTIVFSIRNRLYVGEQTGQIDVYDLGNYNLINKLSVCNSEVKDIISVNSRIYLGCADGTFAYFYISQPNFIEREFFNRGISRLCYDPYNGGVYFSTGQEVIVVDNVGGSIRGEIETGGDIDEMVDLP